MVNTQKWWWHMKKVYAADDNPEIANIIRISLSKLPEVEVTLFEDGLQLYRAVQQSIPDLIISDIILPRLEGLALVRLLKFHESYRHIPVLVISSVIDADIEEQVKEVRADDFLRKPFRPGEIRDRTGRLLSIPVENIQH